MTVRDLISWAFDQHRLPLDPAAVGVGEDSLAKAVWTLRGFPKFGKKGKRDDTTPKHRPDEGFLRAPGLPIFRGIDEGRLTVDSVRVGVNYKFN